MNKLKKMVALTLVATLLSTSYITKEKDIFVIAEVEAETREKDIFVIAKAEPETREKDIFVIA